MPDPKRTVDRRLAQMIAYKRLFTGVFGVICGVLVIAVSLSRGAASPMVALAVAIFFGGGAWALRDGLRLRRELRGPHL
jgi:hypothetical protein